MQGPSRFLEDLPPGVLAAPRRGNQLTPRAPAIVNGNWDARRQKNKRFGRGTVDEFDQRTHDDEPVFDVDRDVEPNQPFRSGDTVQHTLLGLGRVVAVSGNGKDMKVIVDFPEAGRKTVLPSYLRATEHELN
jgi:hypothetical protein